MYRILSLDGGGSWALIQVKMLIDLYSPKRDGTDVTGHDVLKNFDLVIANSGGTLTLGGLIKDLSLSDLLNNFFLNEAQRDTVFVSASVLQDPAAFVLRPFGIGPKYSAEAKLKGLKAVLQQTGEMMVSDVPRAVGPNYAGKLPDVVFCAFDYDVNREVFFRSNLQSAAASGSPPLQATVVNAIHASTNAPVNYFDAPAQGPNNTRYWDGAIGGYDNPVLAGVIEAFANGILQADIWALSIGTGSTILPLQFHAPHEDPVLVAARETSTIPNDLKKLASSILDDPPDAASFIAHVMLGGSLPSRGMGPITSGHIIRANPSIQPIPGDPPVPWKCPPGLNENEFNQLARTIEMDAIKRDEVKLIVKLAEQWIAGNVPNQGIRMRHDTLATEIGHGTYAQAKAAWLKACPVYKPPPAAAVA